mgnify:CR=1 FL=1
MEKNAQEITSPSGKYKAIILEKQNYYHIDVFVLSKDDDPNTHIDEYWSKKNRTPILVDKGYCAKHFAMQELRVLLGEPDLPLSIDWVKDFSFCEVAEFLNPSDVHVFCECVKSENGQKEIVAIEAKTVINFEGLCLVEEAGYEDNWLMGQMNKGKIICWGNYGTLKDALKSL